MNDVEFTIQSESEGIWQLEGLRLSFPQLWETGMYEGNKKPRFDAAFLIPIDQKDVVKQITKAMVKVAHAENPKITKLIQTVTEKKYLKLTKTSDGKHYVLKTSNDVRYPAHYFGPDNKDYGNNPTALIAMGADKVLYAGAHVRIKLTVNASTHNGKFTLWVNLSAIQFLSDGEKFGGGGMSETDMAKGFSKVEVKGGFDSFGGDKKKGKKSKKKKGKKSKKKSDDAFSDDDLNLDED